LGILVNSEIESELHALYPDSPGIDEEKLIKKLRADITDEEIERNVTNCRNLTLNISDECNFRCKYCVYSGIYESTRSHSDKKMELSTAKKAVDLFLKTLGNKKRGVKYNKVYIGLYGGEALLEFGLIKDIVKYVKVKVAQKGLDKLYEVEFRLSTNGYLLNKRRSLISWSATILGSLSAWMVRKRSMINFALPPIWKNHGK
jgi:sulfatase maturation enzyme AslB (radical SAM superfamily)